MFDKFEESQSLAFSLLFNSVKNNKISHAYLIDGNNYEFAYDFVLSFAKMLICDDNYINNEKCGNCNICERIDNGNYSELKIIESDGLFIKKEQLLDLQVLFSKSAIEGKRRIYIIKDCDKMNKHASNSLLKFLEEPVDNVIAILFTNDISKVLSTIVSRCQLVRLKKNNYRNIEKTIFNFANVCCNGVNEVNSFVKDTVKCRMIDDILSFINYFEENGLDAMIYIKKMWYNSFSDRDNCIFGVILLLYFYYDVFKYYYGISDYFFVEYSNEVANVANLNAVDVIIKKINICIDTYESLKCNVNINLIVDDLLIKFEECKDEYC